MPNPNHQIENVEGPAQGDAHEHRFVFLRREVHEPAYRDFKSYDVYFCERCLSYRNVFAPDPPRQRQGSW